MAPVVLIAASGTALLPRCTTAPVAFTLMTAWLALATLNLSIPRTQAGEIAAVLNRQAAAGDTVVFCPDQLGPAVTRLLHTPAGRLVYPTAGDPATVDWVDYKRRNRTASATAFAARLLHTHPGGRIRLVIHDGYRTCGHQCADLRRPLAATVGSPQVRVPLLREATEGAALLMYR
ncbi:hypothetical protein [Streptomyces sp. NPDC003710]